MSFRSLNSALKKHLRQKAFVAAWSVFEAQKLLPSPAKAISLRNGSLKLSVPTSIIAAQIKSDEDGLIKKINQALGGEKVEKLSFRVGE